MKRIRGAKRWPLFKQDAPDSLLNPVLGGAGGVIEDENTRVGQQGACYGDALPLTTRKSHAALTNLRFIAVLKAGDEIVCLCVARRCLWGHAGGPLPQPIAMYPAMQRKKRKDYNPLSVAATVAVCSSCSSPCLACSLRGRPGSVKARAAESSERTKVTV